MKARISMEAKFEPIRKLTQKNRNNAKMSKKNLFKPDQKANIEKQEHSPLELEFSYSPVYQKANIEKQEHSIYNKNHLKQNQIRKLTQKNRNTSTTIRKFSTLLNQKANIEKQERNTGTPTKSTSKIRKLTQKNRKAD